MQTKFALEFRQVHLHSGCNSGIPSAWRHYVVRGFPPTVRSILQNNTAMECDGARRQQWQPNQRSYAHNSRTPTPAHTAAGGGVGGVASTGTMQYTRTCIRQSILLGANNRSCERKPKLSVLRYAARQDQKGSGAIVGSILLG